MPDISKWNTTNVTDMSSMFNKGYVIKQSSLSSLPNISKWNTSNVFNMSHMFSCCLSLTSLPDISKWNTFNVLSFNFNLTEELLDDFEEEFSFGFSLT